MINTLGGRMNNGKLVIADADILISTLLEQDANHYKVMELRKGLVSANLMIKFPNTAILEAVTVLRRVFNSEAYAKAVNSDYLAGKYDIFYVDETIQKIASEIFAKEKSKKNTIFDAIVLATAKITKADGVFSFDTWYKKQGVKMVSDLV